MSGGTRTIAANASALALAKGGTMLLNLATFAHLTRALEPDAFGVLAWAMALLGYFGTVVELGLGTLYIREVARNPSQISDLAGWLLGMRSVLLGAALIGFGLIVWSLDRPLVFRATVAIVGLSLIGNAVSLDWAYHGTQRMGRIAVRNIAASAVTLVGALTLVRQPDDLLWAAGVTAAGVILPNLSIVGLFLREYGAVRPRYEWNAWRPLLRSAIPIGTVLFLMQIYATIDQLMLGVLRSEAEVGWYASAYRIQVAVLAVNEVLQQAFLPALSEVDPESEAARARGRGYVTALALFGLPLAFGGAVFADDVLVLFAGDDFRPGGAALAVLLVYAAVVSLTKSWGDSLVAWQRERAFLGAIAAAAGVNVVLNLALIPKYGAVGAAAATVVSGLVAAAGTAVTYRRLMGTIFAGPLARVLAVAVVGVLAPAAGVRALGGSVWSAVLVAAPAYVALAVVARAVPASVTAAVRARLPHPFRPAP